MAGHWGFFQRRGWHLLSLATSPWDRVWTSGKLFPWEAGFLPNGPQGRMPRRSLRLPRAQERGEGLRPCLVHVVSSTWVCGILLTWLPPLGIGFPQQERIVRPKPFGPQGVSGLCSLGLNSC